MTSFISILLSFNAIKALVPVIIIGALIAAAAGLSRNKSLFAIFGVGTVLGSAGLGGSKKVIGNKIVAQKVTGMLDKNEIHKNIQTMIAAKAGMKVYKNEISGRRVNVNRTGSLFNAKSATALGLGTTVTYLGGMPKRIGFAVAKEKEIAKLKSDKDKAAAKGLIQQDSEIRKDYDNLETYRNTIAANSIKLDLEKSMMHSKNTGTAKKAKIEYRKLKDSQKKLKMKTIKLSENLMGAEHAVMRGGVGLGLLNRDDVIDIHRHLDAQIESLNKDVRIGNYGVYNKTSEQRTQNLYEIDKMTKRRQHKKHPLKK